MDGQTVQEKDNRTQTQELESLTLASLSYMLAVGDRMLERKQMVIHERVGIIRLMTWVQQDAAICTATDHL